MTQIINRPLFLTEATIIFPGDADYAQAFSGFTITPPAPPAKVEFTGLGGNTESFRPRVPGASWTAAGTIAQDWETTNSFSQYLLEHDGEEVPVVITHNGGEPWYTTLTITPTAIGGDVNTVNTGAVSMDATRPSRTPPSDPDGA